MARRPEVFARALSMEEGRKLQRVTRTAKDPVKMRRAIMGVDVRPGRPSAISSPPRWATTHTSVRNWPGCRPVNGAIHADRDAAITRTPP